MRNKQPSCTVMEDFVPGCCKAIELELRRTLVQFILLQQHSAPACAFCKL